MNDLTVLKNQQNPAFILRTGRAISFLLYSAVFLLGLGFHVAYIFILLLIFSVRPGYLLRPSFNKSFLVLFLLISVFLLPQYLVGYSQVTLDNPIASMLSVMFSIVMFGLLLQQLPPVIIRNSIVFFVVGVGVEALITVVYSFIDEPYFYGYGRLYNPFHDREENSPGAALKIACLSSVGIWFIFNNKSLYKKIALLAFVSFLTLLAAWLASRAYFVILFFALVLCVFINLRLKNIIIVVMLGGLGLISFYALFQNFDASIFSQLSRFDGGLESARFLLWKDGVVKLLTHPIGGFDVDQTIDPVQWFHNVFLDSARLAGWMPVLSLIAFVFYSFWLYLNKRNEYYLFAGFVFSIVFVIMQQDVVIEAMVRLLVLLYFCAILLGSIGSKCADTKLVARRRYE